MKKLRSFLDNLEPLFTQGGRLERFHALFEAVDTFLFSPPDLSRGAPHIRDALDLKRVMITVVIAATPAALAGMWNTGYQANMAMEGLGLAGLEGWRGALLPLLGAGYDPASIYDSDVGSDICRRAQPRGQRGFLRYRLPVCADPPGDDTALAGWRRYQLRRDYR
jgi:Na+-transporting NADH:ubiquinone oxidoreductase subunit B